MFLFLFIFSITLLLANIYFFVKKKYLYIFIPCMLFLPKYYGIEFSPSFPVLTVSRIMYLILYTYAIVNGRKKIGLYSCTLRSLPKHYVFIGCYFILRLISNLYYISSITAATKTILEIIFEQLLFVIAIFKIAPTREEVEKIIRIVVYTAFVMFIIGIFESFTFIRPFDALYTVSRNMPNQHFVRLGLLRSTTTMGFPIFYGNMCLIILPLVLYLYRQNFQKRFLVISFFNILAIIHSGSRADIFFLIIIVCFYYFIVLKDNTKLSFFKNAIVIIVCIIMFTSILSYVNRNFRFYYEGSLKAVLNEVGFDFDINKNAPAEDFVYGENRNYGSESRLVQFSGIYYTITQNALFGLGAKSQERYVVNYYSHNNWHPSNTFDVGYVEVFCNEGIIGFLGYFSLILAFLYLYIRSTNPKSHYKNSIALMTFSYYICMLSTANMYSFLFLILMLAFYE